MWRKKEENIGREREKTAEREAESRLGGQKPRRRQGCHDGIKS